MNLALFPFLHFFTRQRYWLLSSLVLLPLLSWGQITIAVQDFETTPGTPTAAATLAGGTFSTGNSGSGDSPAGVPLYSQGSRAYGVSNRPATITSSADVDASGYASVNVSFRLASFSITSTNNGAEANDQVTLAISTDGGNNYVNQVIVGGNLNARWRFASGTGTASRVYAATANTAVTAPAAGGSRTTDGYSTVVVTGIPSTAQLRFRITLLNNDANERWLVDDLQVTGTSAGPTTPTLAATPTALNSFSTSTGTPSATQTYALTGTNVTAATTVTAPGGFAVSLDGTTYAASVSAPAAAVNSTSGQPIYVRLTGAAAGTFSGNVTNTSGAAAVPVTVSGTTAGAPALTVGTIGAGFNTLAGAPSAAQTYALSGTNLTDNVTITTPTGFEVSLSGASADYATTKTVLQSGGAASATVYVRLAGTGVNAFGGNVTNASPGATTRTVAVTGTVVGRPTGTPTVAAGTLTFNSAALTLGAADGTNLLVVVRPAGTTTTAPIDQTSYAASTTYGTGTALGAGFVVFAAANATGVTVAGLSESTAYVADVYTYNQGTVAGFESYGLGSGTAAFATPAQPAAAPGLLLTEENFDYPNGTVLATSTTVADATTGWTAYNGTGTNNLATAADNQVQAQYPQGVLAATPAGTSTQVALALNGQDVYKSFAAPTVPDRYYVASVVNITTAQANGDYFLALYDNTSGGGTQHGRVFVRATTGGINFGVSVDAGTSAARYSSTVYSLNTPYLVVLRYDTNGTAKLTNDDVATLYVLDNSATPVSEPTTAMATSGPSTGALAATNFLNAVALRQGSRSGAEASATLLLDGLRVATGWGAAVGRPVYTTSANTIAAGDYYSLRVAGVGTQVSTNGTVRLEKQLNLDGGQVVTSTTSPLVLRARPTIGDGFDILVNPGGTSYVDGPVAREAVGGPSLLFPIGRNGNYRPLTLNITSPPSGTTTYTAAQTEGTPADQTISEPLTRISRVRYFSITPSPVPAAGVFTGTVTLSFGSDDDVTDPSVASFVVAKSDGAGWSSIGRGVNTASSLTSDTFQDFSDFSLASTAADVTINPLPVQLTSFAAARTASGVQVAWATASELGSDHFEVERSLNGTTFGRVASVPAQGNTTQAHRYTALDRSAPAALLYYRLRQVDRDGTVAYSPTVTVAAGAGATAEFALAPNPAHASISFLTEAATAYTVRNPLGQAVRTGTTHPGTNTIAVDDLPAGVYLFELHGSQGRVVRRFVKE